MVEIIQTLWNVCVSLSKFCGLVGRDSIINTLYNCREEELKYIRELPTCTKLFIHRLKFRGEGLPRHQLIVVSH